MRQQFKQLLGKMLPFFDKSGGVLDLQKVYRRDWFNVEDFLILEVGKKAFVAMDTQTGQKATYRYSCIFEADDKGIVFN